MTCASVELIEAMRDGTAPWPNYAHSNDDDFLSPCGSDEIGIVAARGYAGGNCASEDRGEVDCPVCVLLMREARGGVRDDALQERESAAKSVIVNAEFDAELAAKSEAA